MKISFKRRFLAYIIDLVFIISILMIIYYLIPKSNNYIKYNNELTILNDKYIANDITGYKYLKEYSLINSKLDKELIYESVINLFAIIIYFVVIPIFTDGQTFGKYIMKIKIKNKNNKKLTILSLLIRSVIINGLGYLTISLIILNIIDGYNYFIISTILGIIQVLTLIITIFMILYRKDKLGLEDIISKTVVVGR